MPTADELPYAGARLPLLLRRLPQPPSALASGWNHLAHRSRSPGHT
ncbi:hypothetical protein ACGFY9_21055 [Streptomyces sp. NPDC048504]